MEKRITVVVCTYNRANLLMFCLQSLAEQSCNADLFNVIIINNNSTDNTEVICQDFIKSHSHFRYFNEKKQGLGYARNRGYKESSTKWIAYVDDDAKAHNNYVERALWVIDNYEFDCFGGIYNAWYTIPKPKWIDSNYGTNKLKQNYLGLLKDAYMDGGNMVWKKEVLNNLGGFHVDIGMKGNKISYGEETYIQELARKQNIKIGFDPELQIDHYVQPYKLKIKWILKSSFANGRDYWATFNSKPSFNDSSWKNILIIFLRLLKNIISHLKRLSNHNYYYQNFIMDVFLPFFYELGKLKGSRSKLS